MTFIQGIISICVGLLLGVLYGFSFLIAGKKTHSFFKKNLLFYTTLFSVIRLGILALVLIFLLQQPMISSMLLIISLLATFWATIIIKKVSV